MGKKEELAQLIEQMRSGDNKAALAAVNTLRKKGWLTNHMTGEGDPRETRQDQSYFFLANLQFANLYNADLHYADLRFIDLTGANLESVDFSGAILEGANLTGANLARANFTGSLLGGVNFMEAHLYQTDFKNAWFGNTILANVDLSEVTNLDTIQHYSRSTLGVNTLYKSKGEIPHNFLRGCGLQDDFIEYIMPLVGQAIEFYSCFISYSHKDKSFARRVHDTLQGRGIRCWLDEHQMLPGDDILEAVNQGIRLWDKVLLCCSESSLKSWWVDDEVERAFVKERDLMKQTGSKVLAIIPLDLDGFLFDGYESAKGDQIKSRLAANFNGWEHDNAIFEREIEKVIRALRTDGGKEPPPSPKLGKH